MYHSYFYLKRLSEKLNQNLTGARLLECFSQEKDELVFVFFTKEEKLFFLKADLKQGIGILSFPANFGRTRSHSVDLFPELIGMDLEQVIQTKNDRSFHLAFFGGLSLCFKMYGHRSNLLLHQNGKIISVFNHHLKKDLEGPVPSNRVLDQSEEAFNLHFPNLKMLYPTFDKWMWSWWDQHTISLSQSQQWVFLNQMVHQMAFEPFLLCKVDGDVIFSFFSMGDVLESHTDPFEVSNRFYYYFWQVNRFQKDKDLAIKNLEQQLFQASQQIKTIEKQCARIEEGNGFRQQADLLMAYGHDLKKGTEVAVFPDFSTGNPVEIRLKKDLSISENAERLYKKSKGQQAETERLFARLELWKKREQELKERRLALEKVGFVKELKSFLTSESVKETDEESLPFHRLVFQGWEIRVGKNAKTNDDLLRMAKKDDWWLHARDVTGSHVVISTQKGKATPQPVLERAAELAAFYSKAKTESLCPVMLTERKYVRKNKSMAAGQVRVEREKTILVRPVGL